MLHELHPDIITIAEDATFYPGLCESTTQGGLGFDYYVNLSVTDLWLWLLQDVPDQAWSMSKIVNVLVNSQSSNRRMLVYCENHNQSISGGRSFAEILFGNNNQNFIGLEDFEFRGSSLHKMIRLISFSIGGSAYLNFMGNEFGHPNRVEFPMESNNYSFAFANRKWDLLKDKGLHMGLFNFDKEMMKLDEKEQILSRNPSTVHHVDDSKMVISYIRGRLLFVFNFHPEKSYENYSIGVEEAGEYMVILNTDDVSFGGRGVIQSDQNLKKTCSKRTDGYRNSLELTLPSRSAQVYKLTRILRI
ncbi:1,4-alpha-glucan branching enzyme protein [Dioscorea alata]|uniref:1,4-alpha-glucan branching enzyme protein n=1 Tax=Dioscorea alata TaxID=55571 RepID=A0ACB7W3L6_DIOAL|nr:1,4-alpha-glucan branching enzyme protein [Dioscorea alata]